MVRAVQAEDSVEAYFDGLIRERVPAQVGLLLGKPAVGSRDLMLAAIATPAQDGEPALTVAAAAAAAPAQRPRKGGGKAGGEPSVSIRLETEWVAEHALQVSRMLPGGVAVLGLYLFGPESGYASAVGQLAAALAAIATDVGAEAAPGAGAGAAAPPPQQQQQLELLLLHVDSGSRKFAARACLASSGADAAAASLKPCELRFAPVLPSLVCLRASHAFDITLPATDAAAQLQQQLAAAAAAEAARIRAALAALPGGHVPESTTQPLADLLPAGSAGRGQPAAVVELYCSPPGSGSTSSGGSGSSSNSSSACCGSSRLRGCIEALAYVHRRDSAAKALTELKADIVRSLAARLQLLTDDALAAADAAREAAADAAAAGGAGGGAEAAPAPAHPLLAAAGAAGGRLAAALPRRVLLPWDSLGLQVTDYLTPGEGPDSAVERAKQLLHFPAALQPSQVVELEAPATQQVAAQGTALRGGTAGAGLPCSSVVLAAGAAGLAAAAAVGLAVLNLGQ